MNWPRIHPAGWPIIAVFAMVSLAASLIFEPLGWIGAAATAWCVLFFRDPDRQPPAGEGLVVSPADGVVRQIARAAPPAELDMGPEPLQRVSVFMNVFDCHVNRMPLAGTVERLEYRPGRFLNASFDKASELNERLSIRVRTDPGPRIAVVQIAGLVARRIASDLKAGRHVATGERIGMIRFGSRLDVYLPDGFALRAAEGERVVAGQTVIAEAVSAAPGRGPEAAPEAEAGAGAEPPPAAESEEVT